MVAIVCILIFVVCKFTWSLSHSQKWLLLILKLFYLVVNPQNPISGESTKIITNHLLPFYYISLLYSRNVSRDPNFKNSEVFFDLKIFSLKSFLSKVKGWKYWMVCYSSGLSWTGILYTFLILWNLQCTLPC